MSIFLRDKYSTKVVTQLSLMVMVMVNLLSLIIMKNQRGIETLVLFALFYISIKIYIRVLNENIAVKVSALHVADPGVILGIP